MTKIKSLIQHQYFISFVLGSISAFAFAPFYIFLLAIIAFSGLFLIIQNHKTNKQAFWIGWWFGFGQFLFGVYWICISLFVDIGRFFWLLPFALILIPAAVAVYIGLSVCLTNFISEKLKLSSWRKVILLAIIWTIFESLRAVLFTGFPWNLIGYSLLFSSSLSQSASLFGIYGLSLLAVIFYTAPALFFKVKDGKIRINIKEDSKLFLGFAALIIGALWLFGIYRINNYKDDFYPNAVFRLVQPAIKQEEKWNPQKRYDSFVENIKLTHESGFENVNYVVWSESAVSYAISPTTFGLLSEIASAAPKNGFVITGGLKVQLNEESRELEKIWNTIFVINDKSQIADDYDKNHLVPFGEYIPFADYLPFVSKITDGAVNFSEGDGLKTIKLNSTTPSFSPLVCYEGIFSGSVIDKTNPPQFFVNLTNDAWFGTSSGPYQHLDMVRTRSIEYGIPLIRVANSGISGLVNPLGKIVAAIPLNERGIVDVMLMKNLPETPYMKFGNKIILLIGFGLMVIVVIRGKNKGE